LPGGNFDNHIPGTAQAFQKLYQDRTVIIVSKDINLRIKAATLGIPAGGLLQRPSIGRRLAVYTGQEERRKEFWTGHDKTVESWQEAGRTFYKINGPDIADWYPSQGLYFEGDEHLEAIVQERWSPQWGDIKLAEAFRSPPA